MATPKTLDAAGGAFGNMKEIDAGGNDDKPGSLLLRQEMRLDSRRISVFSCIFFPCNALMDTGPVLQRA